MQATVRLLVIEDDSGVAGSLQKELKAEGYDAVVASRGDDGLAAAKREAFGVVITDLKMPGLSGLDLVGQLHSAKPKLPIILMTAFGTTETAIEAIRHGAYEYVLKPFEMTELLDLVAKAAACEGFTSGLLELGPTEYSQLGLVGRSRAMQALYKEIGRAGQASMNVLVRGETGTGKELVAQAIHQHSSRAAKPFIAVNCTAIPETLLESELFGYERGAFTGAQARRIGRFEQAGGGTLFLDEIGDLNPGTQAKLLRVLQERRIQRLGGNQPIAVDTRVLAVALMWSWAWLPNLASHRAMSRDAMPPVILALLFFLGKNLALILWARFRLHRELRLGSRTAQLDASAHCLVPQRA